MNTARVADPRSPWPACYRRDAQQLLRVAVRDPLTVLRLQAEVETVAQVFGAYRLDLRPVAEPHVAGAPIGAKGLREQRGQRVQSEHVSPVLPVADDAGDAAQPPGGPVHQVDRPGVKVSRRIGPAW